MSRPRPPACLAIGLLAALLAFAPARGQAPSAEQYADEAIRFHQESLRAATPSERGRLVFLSVDRLTRLTIAFPRHPAAAQVAFGRYQGIDVLAARKLAADWRQANPDEARRIEEFGAAAAITPRFGGAASGGGAQAAIPSFKPSAGLAPQPSSAVLLSRTEVVEKLRESVVIVYKRTATTYGHGTGFFISPRHILTNTHVVEGHDLVVLANKRLGVRAGRVLSRGANSQGAGIDTAVIELQGAAYDKFLSFASGAIEGEAVAVAGYPGTALTQDRGATNFFALLNDGRLPTADAMPAVRFDFGTMQGVYIDQTTGIENIQNGINVTSGNSGSPIVNQCGNVIAQHYAGSVSALDVRGNSATVNTARFNYSISFRELLKFLRVARTEHSVVSGECR